MSGHFAALDGLRGLAALMVVVRHTRVIVGSECEEGDLNPHGCYPTSPSN